MLLADGMKNKGDIYSSSIFDNVEENSQSFSGLSRDNIIEAICNNDINQLKHLQPYDAVDFKIYMERSPQHHHDYLNVNLNIIFQHILYQYISLHLYS